MPESFEIDPRVGLVTSRVWGVVTDEEVRQHYLRLLADPRFDPSFRQLADVTGVTAVAASVTTVAVIARTTLFREGVRRAVVASSDLQYGMARLFAAYSEEGRQNVRVFRDLAAARAWLALGETEGGERAEA